MAKEGGAGVVVLKDVDVVDDEVEDEGVRLMELALGVVQLNSKQVHHLLVYHRVRY